MFYLVSLYVASQKTPERPFSSPVPLSFPVPSQKTLEKDFMLEPKDLGPNLKETIKYVLLNALLHTLDT